MIPRQQLMLRLLMFSALQDALGLGSEARMNFPSRAQGNWTWRVTDEQLTPQVAERLAELATLYGREGER